MTHPNDTEVLTIPVGLCQCGCGGLTRLATKTDRSAGCVKGEPRRFIQGHKLPPVHGSDDPLAPIYKKHIPSYIVDSETGCWNWQRAKTTAGYGTVTVDDKTRLAHVVSYESKFGPVPEGMELDHLCRNRGCINPDHLEPVSHAENTQRGRLGKIDHEIARRIREDRKTDSVIVIAKRYGVSRGCVYGVLHGVTWLPSD
jgi:hypothetical protein